MEWKWASDGWAVAQDMEAKAACPPKEEEVEEEEGGPPPLATSLDKQTHTHTHSLTHTQPHTHWWAGH